jgi:hypothetical protein
MDEKKLGELTAHFLDFMTEKINDSEYCDIDAFCEIHDLDQEGIDECLKMCREGWFTIR